MWEEAHDSLVPAHCDQHVQHAAHTLHQCCVLCCAGCGSLSQQKGQGLHDALKDAIKQLWLLLILGELRRVCEER